MYRCDILHGGIAAPGKIVQKNVMKKQCHDAKKKREENQDKKRTEDEVFGVVVLFFSKYVKPTGPSHFPVKKKGYFYAEKTRKLISFYLPLQFFLC